METALLEGLRFDAMQLPLNPMKTTAAPARAHEAVDAEQMEALLERLEPKKDPTLEWYKKR